jgi:hypothetical protein
MMRPSGLKGSSADEAATAGVPPTVKRKAANKAARIFFEEFLANAVINWVNAGSENDCKSRDKTAKKKYFEIYFP